MPTDKEIEEVAKEIYNQTPIPKVNEIGLTTAWEDLDDDYWKPHYRGKARKYLEAAERVRELEKATQAILKDDYDEITDEDLDKLDGVVEDRWQPIATAPRDGTEIIITNGCDTCTGKYYRSNVRNYYPFFAQSVNGELRNEGFDYKVEPVYFYEPTHWMPLPPPPTNTNDTSERLSNKNKDNESYVRDAYIDGLNYHDKSSVNSFLELDNGHVIEINKDNVS